MNETKTESETEIEEREQERKREQTLIASQLHAPLHQQHYTVKPAQWPYQ